MKQEFLAAAAVDVTFNIRASVPPAKADESTDGNVIVVADQGK